MASCWFIHDWIELVNFDFERATKEEEPSTNEMTKWTSVRYKQLYMVDIDEGRQ